MPSNLQIKQITSSTDKPKSFLPSLILALSLLANISLAVYCVSLRNEIKQRENMVSVNSGIIDFTNTFIEKVLKAKSEVDFETRLKLENDVRNLNDAEILDQWKKFIESKDEYTAQENVKNFLQTLVLKIKK